MTLVPRPEQRFAGGIEFALQARDEIQRGWRQHLVDTGEPGAAHLDSGRGGSG